jgi:uncharacterized protein (DUF1499 family)
MRAVEKGTWARRLTWAALLLSLGGTAAALIAAVGSGQGAWEFGQGFAILRYAFFAAIAGGLLAMVALVLCRRAGRRGGRLNLLSLAVSLLFVGYLGNQIATARSVPAIHDAATNLDDLPQFRALRVREDYLKNVPDEGDPALAAMEPEARWKAIHRRAYGDLKTLHVPWTPGETLNKARMVAEKKGWAIAHVDPARGLLEATDTTRFFRFKDDVVVRVRAAPKGGSNVDMRSISRVGGSDVGVNAARIRDYLEDLRRS